MRAWCLPRWPTPMTATCSGINATTKTREHEKEKPALLRVFVPSWPKAFALAFSRGSADDADPRFVRGANDGVAVDHQRLAGVDRQRVRAGGLHGRDRRDADDRDVEPHVLI